MTWIRDQEAHGFPALTRGDTVKSWSHGPIGTLISAFQGRLRSAALKIAARSGPGGMPRYASVSLRTIDAVDRFAGRAKRSLPKAPSHVMVYIGRGLIAHQTWPKSGVTGLVRFCDRGHSAAVCHPRLWTDAQRDAFATKAGLLAQEARPYSKWEIAVGFVDNLFERLTWDDSRQKGKRPLASLLKDRNGDRSTVCSSFWEYVLWHVFRVKCQDAELGRARPLDVDLWLSAHDVDGGERAPIVATWERGVMTFGA